MKQTAPQNAHKNALVRSLGFKESLALVIGTVIGTGVFLKAAVMSQQAGSPTWVLVAWAVAGVLSLAGALCYAELGGLFPRAGGEYVFLKEAYGAMAGFLFGWMRFWIGTPGSIAAYAVGAATFAGGVLPFIGPDQRPLVAVGIILCFSIVNCFSVAFGGRVQTFMTLLKVLMIVGLTSTIFMAAGTGTWAHLASEPGTGHFTGFSAFGMALLAALWAYDGWNNMPMAAGEIRDPGRTIPKALGLGMLAILGIYALANLAYFYALPFGDVTSAYSSSHRDALPVATRAAEAAFGPVAVSILSVAFVLSALGAMNGSILTGARIPYAMAKDDLFFKGLGKVSDKASPVMAVLIQAAISCGLALSGTFDQLTDYVVFAGWIFYALGTGAIFVFRARMPKAERPYRVPFYPVLPALFLICSVLLLINTLINSPKESGIGLAFIVAGVPAYFWFRRKRLAIDVSVPVTGSAAS